MQVILLERIRKLGQMGDTVTVKDGFARNFLLPQGKALRATKSNRTYFDNQKAQLEARNLELRSEAEKVAVGVNGKSYILIRQAGESGQLYGSVSSRDIVEAVGAGGIIIARPQVNLDKPIKEIGLHKIEIILHADVIAEITINVARSPDEAERQSRGENVVVSDAERDAAEARAAAEDLFEDAPPEDALSGEDLDTE